MLSPRSLGAVVLTAALPALAQTFTDCNPLQKTCPSNPGLSTSTQNTDFASGSSGWSTLNSGVSYGGNGAAFTISGDGQAPTIQSDNYIFFGRVDVTMKSAPGVGIVSSIVLQSEDLDEIDWEFLGGDPTHVQSNFFGKGDTSSYDRVTFIPTANTQADFHTYSIDWTAERIQWLIDGAVVRTLSYGDALAAGGRLFPQTPARVKLGNWVGGGANNAPGTVQWAGGKTDFSAAPFVMTVKEVKITNYNPATSYTYSDNSGSWQSITLNGGSQKGNSGAGNAPANPPASSAAPAPAPSTTAAPVLPSSSSMATTSSTTVAPPVSSSPAPVSSSSALSTGVRPSSTLSSSASSTASSSARASYTGAASSLKIGTAGSLLGVVAAMLML